MNKFWRVYSVVILLFPITEALSQCNSETFTMVGDTATQTYTLVKKDGEFKKLDPEKYTGSLTLHENAHFAVFAIKGYKGWMAIDYHEKPLFEVFNILEGEPWPDMLIENRIRVVGENGKIGFANECGEIVIAPQFTFVTHFHAGKAIIVEDCKKIRPYRDKQGYRIVVECLHGYINNHGKVIKLGNYTFEEIKKEIGWEPYNDAHY
ncbi:MAG: WG repeat-containing protein [Leadbetterella sp.]|nr:WG repeat-containing protein [Leadbetterella sp.]